MKNIKRISRNNRIIINKKSTNRPDIIDILNHKSIFIK